MIYLSSIMQFNNPNILYALAALVIPIVVHLFQLRKFQKTSFTNVKFLKEISVETRKSSQLKKWLILCCRLLIFTCIIFAFSEPYLTRKKTTHSTTETVLYIDNSFSNKMKGAKGELLKVKIQEVLEHFPLHEKITVLTNTKTYTKKTLDELKQELIAIDYTPTQLSYKTVALKAEKLFSKNNNTEKHFIYLSDFQKNNAIDTSFFSKNYKTTLLQSSPVSKSNISIDSAYFSSEHANNNKLNVVVRQQHNSLKTVPISVYNNDSLVSKTSIALKKSTNTIALNLGTETNLNIKIQLTYPKNTLGNTLYINKQKPRKQNVLAIGSRENNLFLTKIYTQNEFNFSQNTINNIDYSLINQQHLIILNELELLPVNLIRNIISFSKKGGTVICIPSQKIDISNYNTLTPVFHQPNAIESRLTKINYAHPLFSGVFEKQVDHFQYPTIKTHYTLKQYQTVLLSLENQNPFLVKKNSFYIFSSALNNQNSNFKQAPLIVPILYNIAKNSLKSSVNYYHIGKENIIDIPLTLSKDEVVSLHRQTESFIPLQQVKKNTVRIQTNETPSSAGFYRIKTPRANTPHWLAFNYDNSENLMTYHNIKSYENQHIKASNSLHNTINEIISSNDVAALWKWFVIFALLFLLIELLILKYFK